MKVEFVISEIEKSYPHIENWPVLVIEDWDSVETEDYIEYRALSIHAEEEDKDINIHTNQLSSGKAKGGKPLMVKSFLHELRALLPQCSDYSMYSATATQSDGEHWIRLDIPLVAVWVNSEKQTFGLIQQGKETKNA